MKFYNKMNENKLFFLEGFLDLYSVSNEKKKCFS